MSGSKIAIHKKCERCGTEFVAYKISTKYCSVQCARRAYKDTARKKRLDEFYQENAQEEAKNYNERPFLSVQQAALLLGVSRRTMYRYLSDRILKAVQFKGKTIIRRNDIDLAFDTAPDYVSRPKKTARPITEFYSTGEVVAKYGVCSSWLYKLGKKENLPKTLHQGHTVWSKKHIDDYFRKNSPDSEITEWYTSEEIMSKYGMSRTAVYSWINAYGIPRKNEKGQVYYSKLHFEQSRAPKSLIMEKPDYCTVQEACSKYHISRDQLYRIGKNNNFSKVQEGRTVKYLWHELDEYFEMLSTPPVL